MSETSGHEPHPQKAHPKHFIRHVLTGGRPGDIPPIIPLATSAIAVATSAIDHAPHTLAETNQPNTLIVDDTPVTTKQQEFTLQRFTPGPSLVEIAANNTQDQAGAQAIIEEQRRILKYDANGVVTPHFKDALSVVEDEKIRKAILAEAKNYGVPPEISLGVALLENGGGVNKTNPDSGARGIYQLMPDTARDFNLRVVEDPKHPGQFLVDERADPEKNIKAGNRFLAAAIHQTGDNGLGVLAFYAGVKNVYDFIDIYAKSQGYELPTPEKAVNSHELMEKYKYYVHKNKLSVHQLLENPAVKAYINRKDKNGNRIFTPETFTYSYQVLAAASEASPQTETLHATMPELPKENAGIPRRDGAQT